MNHEGSAGERNRLITLLHEKSKVLQEESQTLAGQSIAQKVFAPGEAVAKFRGDVEGVFNGTLSMLILAKIEEVARRYGECQPPPSFRMIAHRSRCVPVLCLQSATDVELVLGLADAWQAVPKALRPAAQPIGHLDVNLLKLLEDSLAFCCVLPPAEDFESARETDSEQLKAAEEARQECLSNLTPPPEDLASSADAQGIAESVEQGQGTVRCLLKGAESPCAVAVGDSAVFVATSGGKLLRLEPGCGQEPLSWKDASGYVTERRTLAIAGDKVVYYYYYAENKPQLICGRISGKEVAITGSIEVPSLSGPFLGGFSMTDSLVYFLQRPRSGMLGHEVKQALSHLWDA